MADDPVFGVVGGLDLLASIIDSAESSFTKNAGEAVVDVPLDREDIKALQWALRELKKTFRAPANEHSDQPVVD